MPRHLVPDITEFPFKAGYGVTTHSLFVSGKYHPVTIPLHVIFFFSPRKLGCAWTFVILGGIWFVYREQGKDGLV